jgi:hypothetical protein
MVTSLADKCLSSWGNTLRVALFLALALGATFLSLWLADVDIRVGPIELVHHDRP